MYCVKCGVRLQEGAENCPLCYTPVWNPDNLVKDEAYPEHYPRPQKESNLPFAVTMTVICVLSILIHLTVCLKLYGALRWGIYSISGIVLFYVVAILPCWFRKPRGEIFVPVDHAAAALFVLLICIKTGGHWFLSFAFPVILASCLISTAIICLLKYVKGGKLFVLGGSLLGIGAFTVLIEFFEHVTFGTDMFRWSIYSLLGFGAAGLILLLAGMIPSMRHALEKRFFF